ncbi:MAG TPA: DinB family protein [Candidatus Hydrogenedentes bacterium]|nr:DinB family protein [Candidatus Hydrogenedentota bacterium]HIJ73156.1 DinB family protein [Candidatus Hydrogenedentota bacterium]
MHDTGEITGVKTTLEQVAAMLEEMRRHLTTLSEDQALWLPPGGDVWPIQRSVTHCVNCEHRAVTELGRAMKGQATPETIPADTGIFAWFGPTPYALARLVGDLKRQVEALSNALDSSHLDVEAVRYPNHPPRKLVDYVEVMRHHTEAHLAAIKKKLAAVPPAKECDAGVREAYPNFGRGAEARGTSQTSRSDHSRG